MVCLVELSGAEQGLGLLELAGLYQVHGLEPHRVSGGEGGGRAGGFGGKDRGERGGDRQQQASRKEHQGFHFFSSPAHTDKVPAPG